MRIVSLFLIIILTSSADARAQAPGATLSVSDFQYQKSDSSLSWLQSGLADMMTTTMDRLSQFEVLERSVRTDGVAGTPDIEAALQQAERLKSQYLITGSYSHIRGVLTIDVGLHNVSSKEEVVRVAWEGILETLPDAARHVTLGLLNSLNQPAISKSIVALDYFLPASATVAEAYYMGRRAFDDGKYEEALTYFESGAHDAGTFLAIHDDLIRIYTLLNMPDRAADHALQTARTLQTNHLSRALGYYYTAAEHHISFLSDTTGGIDILAYMDSLATDHERTTGDAVAMKRDVMEQAVNLHASGRTDGVSAMLRMPTTRHLLWTTEIEDQMQTKAVVDGYQWIVREGRREKVHIPGTTVFMWRIRSLLTLARTYVRHRDIDRGTDAYRQILSEYDFIRRMPGYTENERLYWIQGIQLEAHFMILYHYKHTGDLIRDPVLMPKVNVVDNQHYFMREFDDPTPDSRARVWSRRDDGGHEYFDFIAPPGYQIDAIIPGAHVDGLAKCSVYLPDPQGWPPQYDFSRRLDQLVWYSGTYSERLDLPEGTEFVSCSILWGERWADSPWEWIRRNVARIWGGAPDIDWWEVRFILSPEYSDSVVRGDDTSESDQRMIRSYVTRFGWDGGRVLHEETAQNYTGGSMDWSAISVGGDIVLLARNDPVVRAELPITINTKDNESEPHIWKNTDDTHTLIWIRKDLQGEPSLFFSTTSDFNSWELPRRMRFQAPAEPIPGHQAPYTTQVVPVSGGYLMMLEEGYTRRSEDLQQWDMPEKQFQYDGRSILLTGRDGAVWAVGTQYLNELAPEGEAIDPMYGYYGTADGRRFKKGDAITVSVSGNGHDWSSENVIRIGKETSGLWAFPRDDDRIGIAAGHHNLELVWISAGRADYQITDDLPVRLMTNGRNPLFFINDDTLYCLRTVRDFRRERQVLLLQHSDDVYSHLYR